MDKNEVALIKKSDMTLVGQEVSLNDKQLQFILKKTPSQYVKQRPAKGGGKWSYVSGSYVRKCLNLMFGWDWDFEILDEKVMIECKEVVVKGRLTCRSAGRTIVKTQYGNKDIMFRKGSDVPLSIGNDMKAAATDALKKCAAELGIAQDVYHPDEFREVKIAPTIKIGSDKWKKAVQAIKEGSITVEQLEQNYDLSDTQIKMLSDEGV